MAWKHLLTQAGSAPSRILPAIIASQFAGTSLWFAGNAVLPDLQRDLALRPDALGNITAAVQFGFIAGTLIFALLAISDRYSPRGIFLWCSVLGAAANAGTAFAGSDVWYLAAARFATGFFIAGIYPVGMKIASGWYQRELGRALGFLVGALVLGTAFPHFVRGMGEGMPWGAVLLAVSVLSCMGGVLMFLLVPDGPHLKVGARFDPGALRAIFASRDFRASSFGYFGHMWELYAFWAFVTPLLLAYASRTGTELNVPLTSFAIIAAGAVGCIFGGLVSLRFGSALVAFAQLAASGLCCLVSPLLFYAPAPVFIGFLLVWGVAIVGDSPQFSALNARYAPLQLVGSALTLANCIGFGITIFSIQLLNHALSALPIQYVFLLLAPGPIFGLLSMRSLLRSK
jgi:MFS family permease